MTGENQGAGVVKNIDNAALMIGTLVPAVAAIATAVRLLISAARPSDAKKAQAFDEASAELKRSLAGLEGAIAGFEDAKAQAPRPAAAQAGDPKPIPAAETYARAKPVQANTVDRKALDRESDEAAARQHEEVRSRPVGSSEGG